MEKKQVFVAQFATGANINLLPLAAGQLVARFKAEPDLLSAYRLEEIIFRREPPEQIVAARMSNVGVLGLSCFLWNTNQSLALAREVRRCFPDAVIILGGPAIPKEPSLSELFFAEHPYIDIVCIEEGEQVFIDVCRRALDSGDFSNIAGMIYRDPANGRIIRNELECVLDMAALPSPYLDGTFDEFYSKYREEFSGIILETNRGCPYRCGYCTWGNQSPKLREKSDEMVAQEIEWVGRNGIRYIAMSDANFGIRKRDIVFTELLARCKQNSGVPNFISVSWVKNSSSRVMEIAEVLTQSDIGFRITLSLQSLNPLALEAANRKNIKRESYDQIKAIYRRDNLYSYTELIFGLPEETLESYLAGLDESLSSSIFDQLYIYPLLLFPNTEMSSPSSVEKHQIQSRTVECIYTKSKVKNAIKEYVDIVVGHKTMPTPEWIKAFTIGYYTLALHDDRLAFFVFHYLRKEFGIRITDLIGYARDHADPEQYPVIHRSIARMENNALDVVHKNKDHLIRPDSYDDIPFDPPEGVFLELIREKEAFYGEFRRMVSAFLNSRKLRFDDTQLDDLFLFQNAVMAAPRNLENTQLELAYDWVTYFGFAFNLSEQPLKQTPVTLKIVDIGPCGGDSQAYLKNHFDIRGVPPLNLLYNAADELVFPPVPMQHLTW